MQLDGEVALKDEGCEIKRERKSSKTEVEKDLRIPWTLRENDGETVSSWK